MPLATCSTSFVLNSNVEVPICAGLKSVYTAGSVVRFLPRCDKLAPTT